MVRVALAVGLAELGGGAIAYSNHDTHRDVVLSHPNRLDALRANHRALSEVMSPVGSVSGTKCQGEQAFRYSGCHGAGEQD
jgi:hypothetical protein